MSRLLGTFVFLLVACCTLVSSAPRFRNREPTCTPTVTLPIKLADYDLSRVDQNGPGLFIYCYPYQYYTWNTVYASDADAACQHLFKPTKCECGITYVTGNSVAYLNVNGTILQINARTDILEDSEEEEEDQDRAGTPITDAFKLVSMSDLVAEQQQKTGGAEATGTVKMFAFEDTFHDDTGLTKVQTLRRGFKQIPTPCEPEHGKVKPIYQCQMPHGHVEF